MLEQVIESLIKKQLDLQPDELKQLRKLNLSCIEQEQFDSCVEYLGEVEELFVHDGSNLFKLNSFPNLKKLQISFSDDAEMGDEITNNLKNLSKLQHLRFISFAYPYGSSIVSKMIQEHLTHLNQLVTLQIFEYRTDSDELNGVIEALPLINNLKNLSLAVLNLNPTLIEQLWVSLSKFEQLESLKLLIRYDEESNDDSESEEVKQVNQVNLREQFKGKNICKTLQNLQLDIYDLTSEEIFQSLVESLLEMENLSLFSFKIFLSDFNYDQELNGYLDYFNNIFINNKQTLKQIFLFLVYEGEQVQKIGFLHSLSQLPKLERFWYYNFADSPYTVFLNFKEQIEQMSHQHSKITQLCYNQLTEELQNDKRSTKDILSLYQSFLQLPYLTDLKYCQLKPEEMKIFTHLLNDTSIHIKCFDSNHNSRDFYDPLVIINHLSEYANTLNPYKKAFSNNEIINLIKSQKSTEQINTFFKYRENICWEQFDEEEDDEDYDDDESENSELESARSIDDNDLDFKNDYHPKIFNKLIKACSSILKNFHKKKIIEIIKIKAYNNEIKNNLSQFIGDVQFVQNNYWDLYF